jgi:16S rRNA (adenine1518-N6/adenine1519-N6)-dimethyltransferase
MIQKEVADKFVAKTGNKNFSALSVIAQSSCTDIFKVVDVPPTAFEPQPKVNSCVVYFKKDRTKKVDKKFKKFLEICFAQPRKVLTKNLSAIIAKDKLMEIFQDLEILSNIRAHQIDTKMYHELFKRITNE